MTQLQTIYDYMNLCGRPHNFIRTKPLRGRGEFDGKFATYETSGGIG